MPGELASSIMALTLTMCIMLLLMHVLLNFLTLWLGLIGAVCWAGLWSLGGGWPWLVESTESNNIASYGIKWLQPDRWVARHSLFKLWKASFLKSTFLKLLLQYVHMYKIDLSDYAIEQTMYVHVYVPSETVQASVPMTATMFLVGIIFQLTKYVYRKCIFWLSTTYGDHNFQGICLTQPCFYLCMYMCIS